MNSYRCCPMEKCQSLILASQTLYVTHIRGILYAENQNLKMLFNKGNCVTVTSADILKSDKLGQKCQEAHVEICCLSKSINYIAV